MEKTESNESAGQSSDNVVHHEGEIPESKEGEMDETTPTTLTPTATHKT